MDTKTKWDCPDVWSAAFLNATDMLLRAHLHAQGRMRWEFDERDGAAFKACQQWCNETKAWVPGSALARSFRTVTRAANEIRRLKTGGIDNGHTA